MDKIIGYEVNRVLYEKGRLDDSGRLIIIEIEEGEKFENYEDAKKRYNQLVYCDVNLDEGVGIMFQKLTRNKDEEYWESEVEVIAENEEI